MQYEVNSERDSQGHALEKNTIQTSKLKTNISNIHIYVGSCTVICKTVLQSSYDYTGKEEMNTVSNAHASYVHVHV